MSIVSYFDHFPKFGDQEIAIRGIDGYLSATDMNKVLGKRFTDWMKTNFASRLLRRLSERLKLPINWESAPSKVQTPLIDYVRGRGQHVWVHPTVAISYAMSNPEFQADINIWIYELMRLGTVNPNYLEWTQEEYFRGLEFNREDRDELYGW